MILPDSVVADAPLEKGLHKQQCGKENDVNQRLVEEWAGAFLYHSFPLPYLLVRIIARLVPRVLRLPFFVPFCNVLLNRCPIDDRIGAFDHQSGSLRQQPDMKTDVQPRNSS
jgi:hypothetical protein